jgi:nitroreductase
MTGPSASPLPDASLAQLFTDARTQVAWRPDPVPRAVLERVYTLARLGPTSANSSPARFVFVTSPEGKARLSPLLSKGNRAKTDQAPVTVIVGYDRGFLAHLPRLYPHKPDAAYWFGEGEARERHALRNSALQGAYLMLAARSLGLDVGPMSGFDAAGVDAAFFPGGSVATNFLCNLGYGRREALPERPPRLAFDEACRFA